MNFWRLETILAARHITASRPLLETALQGFGPAAVADCQVLAGAPLEAANTLASPQTVTPNKGKKGSGAAVANGILTAKLPPHSYQMIRLTLS